MHTSCSVYICTYNAVSGRMTGTVTTVCSSGHNVIHFVPVYEGYYLPYPTTTIVPGGTDVAQYLIKLFINQYAGTDVHVDCNLVIIEYICEKSVP